MLVLIALPAAGTLSSAPAARHHDDVEQRQVQLLQARDLLGSRGEDSARLASAGALRIDQVNEFVHAYVARAIRTPGRTQASRVARAILAESQRHGFDPLLMLAVIQNESGFDPSVIGGHGEIGLMQLKPDTAEWIARKTRVQWNGSESLHDPVINVRLGAAYLAMLREEFGYSKDLYLAAYNMGSRNVRRILSTTKASPQIYAQRTTQHYSKIYIEFMGQGRKPKPTPVSIAAI